jgi:hypothetical protein
MPAAGTTTSGLVAGHAARRASAARAHACRLDDRDRAADHHPALITVAIRRQRALGPERREEQGMPVASVGEGRRHCAQGELRDAAGEREPRHDDSKRRDAGDPEQVAARNGRVKIAPVSTRHADEQQRRRATQ